MDIKMIVVQRGFDIAGNLISDLLSKPDWEARSENISHLYKDLQSIKDNCPDAPTVREIPNVNANVNANANANANERRIIDEVCTPDLSPKEMMECKSCVDEVVRNPDVLRRYMKPSL